MKEREDKAKQYSKLTALKQKRKIPVLFGTQHHKMNLSKERSSYNGTVWNHERKDFCKKEMITYSFSSPNQLFSLLPCHIRNYTHIKAEISTMSWFEGCTGRASVTLASIKCCKQSISEGDQRFTFRSNEMSCRYNT